MKLIGRTAEKKLLKTLISAKKNILIEGPVGVGKTFLVLNLLNELKKDYERIDGDTRYTEQKLTGWFDPQMVLKTGYQAKTFIDGPLLTSLRKGLPLFINELNRMPESVQNILLPAMDERRVSVPKIGEVKAKDGFLVIATQNPKEFTATHSLSEALLDRFEMVKLDYQTEAEELEILKLENLKLPATQIENILKLIRNTRYHPAFRRGASIRAAISMSALVSAGMPLREAALTALPTRIELLSSDDSLEKILDSLLDNLVAHPEKKNLRKTAIA